MEDFGRILSVDRLDEDALFEHDTNVCNGEQWAGPFRTSRRLLGTFASCVPSVPCKVRATLS
jgi:hypothetical protein